MTAIDRTAYPRLGTRLTREELVARYTLTEADLVFVRANARGNSRRLLLAVLLKIRQDAGYFPALDEIRSDTAAHVAAQFDLTATVWPDGAHRNKSLYRYQAAIRTYIWAKPYDEEAEELLSRITLEAAETMSDPADLINRAVETLQAGAIDLPAFSTLDRLVNRLRTKVHARIYRRIAALITAEQAAALDALLAKPANSITTGFNRLKQAPGPASPTTIRLWSRYVEAVCTNTVRLESDCSVSDGLLTA